MAADTLKDPLIVEAQIDALNAETKPESEHANRQNFGLAVLFSCVPFIFNSASKVVTKEIASQRTPVEYHFHGWTVPAGTVFAFPIFLATVQFLSNAIGAVITYKVVSKGSFCEEMRKALNVGPRVIAQLTFTKATSSIGAKTGLMGMPLSLYAVSRALAIPVTQGMRLVVLKKAMTGTAWMQAALVFGGVSMCFFAQDQIQGAADAISPSGQTITWSFVIVFIGLGVFMTSLHGVYVEQVFDKNDWHPLVAIAYENFASAFVCFLFWPVFTWLGWEDMMGVLICFYHSTEVQCLVAAFLCSKFITNTCATYTIYHGDAFKRIALQRPAKIGSQFAIELIAFYWFGNLQVGRPWVNPWSFMVVVSIIMVVIAASFKEKKDKKNKKDKNGKKAEVA